MAEGTSLGNLYFELGIQDNVTKQINEIKRKALEALSSNQEIVINSVRIGSGAMEAIKASIAELTKTETKTISIEAAQGTLESSINKILTNYKKAFDVVLLDEHAFDIPKEKLQAMSDALAKTQQLAKALGEISATPVTPTGGTVAPAPATPVAPTPTSGGSKTITITGKFDESQTIANLQGALSRMNLTVKVKGILDGVVGGSNITIPVQPSPTGGGEGGASTRRRSATTETVVDNQALLQSLEQLKRKYNELKEQQIEYASKLESTMKENRQLYAEQQQAVNALDALKRKLEELEAAERKLNEQSKSTTPIDRIRSLFQRGAQALFYDEGNNGADVREKIARQQGVVDSFEERRKKLKEEAQKYEDEANRIRAQIEEVNNEIAKIMAQMPQTGQTGQTEKKQNVGRASSRIDIEAKAELEAIKLIDRIIVSQKQSLAKQGKDYNAAFDEFLQERAKRVEKLTAMPNGKEALSDYETVATEANVVRNIKLSQEKAQAEVKANEKAAESNKKKAEKDERIEQRRKTLLASIAKSIKDVQLAEEATQRSRVPGLDTSQYRTAIDELNALQNLLASTQNANSLAILSSRFSELKAKIEAARKEMEALNSESVSKNKVITDAQSLLQTQTIANAGNAVLKNSTSAAMAELQNFINGFNSSSLSADQLRQKLDSIKQKLREATKEAGNETKEFYSTEEAATKIDAAILRVKNAMRAVDNYKGTQGNYWRDARAKLEEYLRTLNNLKSSGVRSKADIMNATGIGVNTALYEANLKLDQQKKIDAANSSTNRSTTAHTKAATAVRKHTDSYLSLNDVMKKSNSLFGLNINLMGQLASQMSMFLSIYTLKRFISGIAEIHGEFQKTKIALGSILNDTAKANELFQQLKSLAVVSPYQFKDLTSFTKQLSAFSFPTDELYDMTKRLADVSAGLGVDMGRIILAVGQVRSASYLRGQELRQFTEAGVPLLDELAKKFTELRGEVVDTGQVFDKISKREVPYEMVRDIMYDLTNEGGKFYKMQEELAGTLAGKISNLTDAYNIMQDEIGKMGMGNFMGGAVDATKKLMLNWKEISVLIASVIAAFAARKAYTLIPDTLMGSNGVRSINNAVTATNKLNLARIREKSYLTQLDAAEKRSLRTKNALTWTNIRELAANKKMSTADVVRLNLMGKLTKGQYIYALALSGLSAQEARHIANMSKMSQAWALFKARVADGVAALKDFATSLISPQMAIMAIVAVLTKVFATMAQKREQMRELLSDAQTKANEAYNGIRETLGSIGSEAGGVRLEEMLTLDESKMSKEMKGKVLKAIDDMKELLKKYSPIAADQIFDIESFSNLNDKLKKAYEYVQKLQDASGDNVKIAETIGDLDRQNKFFQKANDRMKTFRNTLKSAKSSELPETFDKIEAMFPNFKTQLDELRQMHKEGASLEQIFTKLGELSVRANKQGRGAMFYGAVGDFEKGLRSYATAQTYIKNAVAKVEQTTTNLKESFKFRQIGVSQSLKDSLAAELKKNKIKVGVEAVLNIGNEEELKQKLKLDDSSPIVKYYKEASQQRQKYELEAEFAWQNISNQLTNLNDPTMKSQARARFEMMMFGFSKEQARLIIDDYLKTLTPEQQLAIDVDDDKTKSSIRDWVKKYIKNTKAELAGGYKDEFDDEFFKQFQMKLPKPDITGWRKDIVDAVKDVVSTFKSTDDVYIKIKESKSVDEVVDDLQKIYKAAKDVEKDMKPVLIKFGLDASDISKYFDEEGNIKPGSFSIKAPYRPEEYEEVLGTAWSNMWKPKTTAEAALNYLGAPLSNSKDSSSSHADKQLQEWRKQFEALKKIYSDYAKWSKELGRNEALRYIQESGMQSEDIGDISKFDPAKRQQYFNNLFSRISKFKMNTDDRKAFENSLKEFKVELDIEIDKDNLQKELDKVKQQIDKAANQWDIFKEWFDTTGDRGLAMNVAFGNIVEDEDFVESLKSQLQQSLEEQGLEFTVDAVIAMEGEATVKDKLNLPDNSPILEYYKKIISEQDKLKKENAKTLLDIIKNNKNFEQQLADVERQREKDLKSIQSESNLSGEERQQYTEGTNKKYDEQRSKILLEQFKATNNWAAVFDDLDRVSSKTLDSMYAKIADFAKGATLGITETKDLISAMRKLREESLTRNPFKTLFSAFSSLYSGSSDRNYLRNILKGMGEYDKITMGRSIGTLKAGQSYTREQIQQEFNDTDRAATSDLDKSITEIINEFNALASAADMLSKMFEAMGTGDGFSDAVSVVQSSLSGASQMQGITSALGIAGPWGAVAGAGIGMVTSLFELGDKAIQEAIEDSKQRLSELQSAYDNLNRSMERFNGNSSKSIERAITSYNQLLRQVDSMGGKLTDSYKKQYEVLINGFDNYAAVFGAKADLEDDAVGILQNYGYQLGELTDESRELDEELQSIGVNSKLLNGITWKVQIDDEARDALKTIQNGGTVQSKSGQLYLSQYASLVAQRAEVEEQLQWEASRGKKKDQDKIDEYADQLAELNDEITNFIMDLADELYGINFEDWAGQLSDSLVTAFRNGENAAEAFKETTNDILSDIANNMVKYNIIQPMFDELEELLFGTVDASGNRTGGAATMQALFDAPETVAQTISEWFNSKGSDMIDEVNAFLKVFNDATGNSLTDNTTNKSGLSASITGITEETADLLASYLNAMRADLSALRSMASDYYMKTMPDVSETLGNQLATLKLIETNTLKTANNTADIAKIADDTYTLLKKATTSGSGVKLNL
jgi:hypothetical protein